ncbi:MAG: type I phosphomannose isomerase catalytic subunit [Planctomycetota bacterium]
MIQPYPLRTEPLFQDYLWGGRNLGTVLGKPIPAEGVWAESWEMIDHPHHQSRVCNGEWAGKSLREIAQSEPEWIFGGESTRPESLPLLLKYLDCQRVLSVQVHPDDTYGLQMDPPDLGKTEAWYIISAEPGAKLYAGLNPGVTAETLSKAMAAGQVEECLHVIEPKAGDCVFIPAGTVHALGEGLLVAEIQQASNTTFRLFDWNRVGADGNPRELHVEQALEVIDFDAGPRSVQTPEPTDQSGRERLVHCEKFVLDRLQFEFRATVAGDSKFHLLTAPKGGIVLQWGCDGDIASDRLEVGQSVLIPATMP